ncbi:MAG: metal-sulfur cluster assembly factor [Bdellovibrionota bacterium]|jgi:metal-sulfur cluster biosynthetic enzyme
MVTKEAVIEALKTVLDPELLLDVWFLGLIYDISIEDESFVNIKMTLTTPACPAGPEMVLSVRERVAALEGVEDVYVTLCFDPPWEPNEEVKALLGFI